MITFKSEDKSKILVILKEDYSKHMPDYIVSKMDKYEYIYDLNEKRDFSGIAIRHNLINRKTKLKFHEIIISIGVDLSLKTYITAEQKDIFNNIITVYNKFLEIFGHNIIAQYARELDIEYCKFMVGKLNDHSYFLPQ